MKLIGGSDLSKFGSRKSGAPGVQRHRMSNRKFGLTLGGLLLIVGLASWFFASQRLDWAFVIGGIFFIIASIKPTALLPVNLMWHNFANHLRFITNWVVLGTIFYLIITPAGLVLRLLGHDPLAQKIDRTAGSYFMPVQRQSDVDTMADWF